MKHIHEAKQIRKDGTNENTNKHISQSDTWPDDQFLDLSQTNNRTRTMNKIIPMVNGKNKTRSNLGGIAVTGMDGNGVINPTM